MTEKLFDDDDSENSQLRWCIRQDSQKLLQMMAFCLIRSHRHRVNCFTGDAAWVAENWPVSINSREW